MTTAPPLIFLQIEGADPTLDKSCTEFKDLWHSRITWSQGRIYSSDLMYERVKQQPEYSELDLIEISDNMRKYGGSFVQAIGHALTRADFLNKIRLAIAFPEYFETYHNFAKD